MRRAPSTPPALPGYEHVRLLGSGGFSDVFLYEQQLPSRPVAVKVLLTDGLEPRARQAFVDEANLMARLSAHPSIVTIFHADIAADDRPYLVMEFCSGPSLGEQVKRGPFAVADALRTGVRLAGAIATAHEAGILHRDIKPANVLTNAYGWPALTDFGISSSVVDEPVSITTTLSELRGGSSTEGESVGMSVPWSPPEMFADRPDPDVRSDVFSLAATLHTLLAGRTPFEIPGRPNGALDLIGRIERGAITPLTRSDVPASLAAVLRRGMATAREQRYASAVEFGRALQRVELELGYAATPLDVPTSLAAEPPRAPQGEEANADETRVRGVTVIDAAPAPAAAVPVPPAAPAASAPPATPTAPALEATVVRDAAPASGLAPALDATVVRGATPSGAAPGVAAPAAARPSSPARDDTTGDGAETPEAAGSPEAPPTGPRARRGVRVLVAAGALLLVAAVVVGVIVGGGVVRDRPDATAQPSDEPGIAIPVETVPSPVLVSAGPSDDGSAAVFEIANPEPEEGDQLRWARAEQPGDRRPVEGDRIVVPLTAPGARVCIEAEIIRAGRASAAPLESCYPA